MDNSNGVVKVLLVDDDSFVHEMVNLLVGGTEFCLVSAENVPDALRIIARDIPDIIITDAMMPGESGFSLIEKVKANPRTQNIPIILWTILEDAEGSVMDASGKADILANKPIYLSDIISSLNKAKQLVEDRRVPQTFPQPRWSGELTDGALPMNVPYQTVSRIM
jgi:CheY-like chemotaxis protein